MGRTGIFILLFLSLIASAGCRRTVNRTLLEAESIIEQHPDSALMMLEGYDMPDNSSQYDSARYNLLLTYARYKNFIDTKEDSIIKQTAEFFLKNDCRREAAQALFLLGMTYKDCDKFGEAAVCFSRGMDIATEEEDWWWTGQCARGMFQLYSKLINSSAQLRYAEKEYEAFTKCGLEDWIAYAMLDIAWALNHHGNVDEAISKVSPLKKIATELNDSILYAEASALMGTLMFQKDDYTKSLEEFADVMLYNPECMTTNQKSLAAIAVSRTDKEKMPSRLIDFIDSLDTDSSFSNEFSVLAENGDYKAAYQSLEKYRALQDSVLSIVMENNVSLSLGQYESSREQQRMSQLKNERISIAVAMLMFVFIICIAYWESIEKRNNEKRIFENKIAALEKAVSDLTSTQGKGTSAANDTYGDQSITIKKVRESYAQFNKVCDTCYQDSAKAKDKIAAETADIIARFTNRENLENIGLQVDNATGGLYSAFKSDFYDLSEENLNIFLYIVIGLSSRSISFLIGQSVDAYYNKKSRLKSRIARSDADKKDEYLKMF